MNACWVLCLDQSWQCTFSRKYFSVKIHHSYWHKPLLFQICICTFLRLHLVIKPLQLDFWPTNCDSVKDKSLCCRPSRTSWSREGRQTGSIPFPNQRFGEGRHGNKVHRSQRYQQWLASAMYFRNCYRSVHGVTRRVDGRWRRKSSVDPGDAPACSGPLRIGVW